MSYPTSRPSTRPIRTSPVWRSSSAPSGVSTDVYVGIVAQLGTALALGGAGTLCFEADVAPALCAAVIVGVTVPATSTASPPPSIDCSG